MEETSFNVSCLSEILDFIDCNDGDFSNNNIEIEKKNVEFLNILYRVIRHYVKHKITLECLEDTVKLMNLVSGCNIQLPSTKYNIFKLFEDQAFVKTKKQYFAKCEKCQLYTTKSYDKNKNHCDICKSNIKASETNFFNYMPIKDQLTKSILKNWPLIQEYNENNDDKVNNTQCLSDMHDAEIFKNLQSGLERSERNVLALVLNTDGASPFKSTSLSVWPIQIIQNFLPPEHRYKPENIITAGLYFGKNKPDCFQYFLPLVNEMQALAKNGIIVTIKDEEYIFEPIITFCVVDLPAKHMLQRIKLYNGKNACTYCKHPGCLEQISANLKMIRYPNTENSYALRNNDEMLKTMKLVNLKGVEIDGVCGISCLVSLPKFDLINGFGIDYMHCVLLGVVKKLLEMFLSTKHHKQMYHINKVKLIALNRKFLSIKPVREIKRQPRSLLWRADYKANEFRSILLYYFPICLVDILPMKYVRLFRLLSSAIYNLLKTQITQEDIDEADHKLKLFVNNFESIFGKAHMVMNTHLLTHIPESVRNLGPLWTHSAFPFERNNGCLLKLINGNKSVLDQISNKYLYQQFLRHKSINVRRKDKTSISFLGKDEINLELTKEMFDIFDGKSNKCIEVKNKQFSVYKKIEQNGIIYTSLLYKDIKSIDYFIGLNNGTIGIAKYYIKFDDVQYAIINKFEERKEKIEIADHILDVEPTKVIMYAPIKSIVTKFIYMKLQGKHYITTLPNPFENE